MTTHTDSVCVCVESVRTCSGEDGKNTKPKDGAAMPPRGRGLRPRQATACTTTTATKKLVSSSTGGLWYHVVAGGAV